MIPWNASCYISSQITRLLFTERRVYIALPLHPSFKDINHSDKDLSRTNNLIMSLGHNSRNINNIFVNVVLSKAGMHLIDEKTTALYGNEKKKTTNGPGEMRPREIAKKQGNLRNAKFWCVTMTSKK